MPSNNPSDQLAIDELKTLLGDKGWKNVSDAPAYFDDPRDRFKGQAYLIVLPETTEEVSAIMRICNRCKIAVIPYSGGTGVVAGQLSIDNEQVIVLSLQRMNNIREISFDDSMLIAEAGCILEHIQQTAADNNMLFPLSMASEGSCRIGGNLATNAGGIQVLRYGNARDLCIGIEAVLADGSVLNELNPLRKNNTGFDMRHLIAGSEGTLGVITAASLSLKPVNPEIVTTLCALESPANAVKLFHSLRGDLGESISGIELMCDFGLSLVSLHFPKQQSPFDDNYKWYLLIDVAGPTGIRQDLENSLSKSFENGLIPNAVIAESESQRHDLWQLREMTPEANRLTGTICSSDTSVPLSQIDNFISSTKKAIAALDPGMRLNSYGHIGDGNIHHNVFPPQGISKPEFIAQQPHIIDAVRMAINETTVQCNGSISAEHGIGRLKTDDLEKYACPTKLEVMKLIKQALDPNNIMNPGAIFNT